MSVATDTIYHRCLPAALAGDLHALGELFDRNHHYIELLARIHLHHLGNTNLDASDIAQETFIKASRGIAGFRGTTEREFLAWLRRVLASVIADQRRHDHAPPRANIHFRHRLCIDTLSDLDQSSATLDQMLPASDTSPSQLASRHELSVILANALFTLPEHYRSVLILRHIDGLALPEIARRMNRSVESVRKLWARGLACMRLAVGEQS